MKKVHKREYPGEDNEVAKKSKPIKIPLTLDPKYRNIGASTKMANVKTDIIDSATGKFYGSKAMMGKVVEEEKMSLLKELTSLNESVIWNKNEKDSKDPEVLVQGMGRFTLSSLKQNVRKKIKDLYDGIATADDLQAWKNAKWKVNHLETARMLETIVKAEEELSKGESHE